MARPKSTAPIKTRINLTVSDETRTELEYLSRITGESVSSLVAKWATKEARKAVKKTGIPLLSEVSTEEAP